MSNWAELGICPNAHGPLVILNHPIEIGSLLPEDMLDVANLMGTDTPDSFLGSITAFCQKCGFVASTPPTHEYNSFLGEWEIPETEEDQTSEGSRQ